MFEGVKQNENYQAEENWRLKKREVEGWRDMENKGIDEGIVDAVTALNINGFPTTNSCEGHSDRGLPFPFVSIQAPNEPKHAYQGSQELFEKIATEKGIPLSSLKRESPEWNVDQYEDVITEHGSQLNAMNERQMTEEFTSWQRENNKLFERLGALIELYQEQSNGGGSDAHIVVEGGEGVGINVRPHSGYERTVDAVIWLSEVGIGTARSTQIIEEIKNKLPARQNAMDDFSDFLKQHYIEQSKQK